jgi:hypothetical protein
MVILFLMIKECSKKVLFLKINLYINVVKKYKDIYTVFPSTQIGSPLKKCEGLIEIHRFLKINKIQQKFLYCVALNKTRFHSFRSYRIK